MAERPEDLNLPNSVIARIIKEALPDGVIVSKDAKLAISKAASVFVLYATSCANNFALQHKRKTISANDVLEAMEEMDFERFVEPLKDSLAAYKSEQKGKKTDKKKAQEKASTPDEAEAEAEVEADAEAPQETEGNEEEGEEVVELDDDDEENENEKEENEKDSGDSDVIEMEEATDR